MNEKEILSVVGEYGRALNCSVCAKADFWCFDNSEIGIPSESRIEYTLWVSKTEQHYRYKSLADMVAAIRAKALLLRDYRRAA